MKKLITLPLIFMILLPSAQSGIWGTEQVIDIKAGDDVVSCNYWVYSTIPKETSESCLYKFSFPGLEPFIKNISPNNFMLEEIPCPIVNKSTLPEEVALIGKLRDECLNTQCEMDNKYNNGTSCKRICVTFTGPMEILPCFTEMFSENKSMPGCGLSFTDEERVYYGGVADTIYIHQATVSNAADFRIVYKPRNITVHVAVGLIISIAIIVFLIIKLRRKED